MVFLALFPGVALLAMFVVLIIMVMLKHGPRLCGLQHHAVSHEFTDPEDQAYEQPVSYA